MRKLTWTTVATFLVSVIGAAAVLFWAVSSSNANADLRSQLRVERERTAASQANAESLYQQLLDEGVEPAALPPSDVVDTDPLVGPAGAPGRPPTATEIAEAVAEYCAVFSCDGPIGPPGPVSTAPGPAGEDGEDGADSTVPGPPGADSTVPGPPGPAGEDGRSVTAVDCLEDGTWRISYSDGTTSSTPGPCRVDIVPSPDPDPPITEE